MNGKLITDRRVIVNKFNHYFVNVAKNLLNSKPDTDFHDYWAISKKTYYMFCREIDSNEIDSIIDNLNPTNPLVFHPEYWNFSANNH